MSWVAGTLPSAIYMSVCTLSCAALTPHGGNNMKTVPTTCPNCGAPKKKPARKEMENGQLREYPTVYTCGTITSPNWSPPIFDKNCVRKGK
jgi:hypothetical protein